MAELSKGMVVQLASGGPKMTIMDLGDYGIIKEGAKCVWFDDKKIKQEEVFDVAVLKEWKTPALPASMNIPSTRW
jgi:uncharacterized protein YodC (DUF2158 family)